MIFYYYFKGAKVEKVGWGVKGSCAQAGLELDTNPKKKINEHKHPQTHNTNPPTLTHSP